MGPKPPSVNTCRERPWKAISGLLASLLGMTLGFLPEGATGVSQCMDRAPGSSLKAFHPCSCGVLLGDVVGTEREWSVPFYHPLLMAHLFNLPTATRLFSLSTQAGMWSHQSKWKTNVGEHLDPPWEAAVSRNLPWKVPQLQNPPPMSLSKKNFQVKFQPQECPWEIRAFGHFFFTESLQTHFSTRKVPSWPESFKF